jgi:hypothetical protein
MGNEYTKLQKAYILYIHIVIGKEVQWHFVGDCKTLFSMLCILKMGI